MSKPKNKVVVKVTRKDGSVEIQEGHNDLTLQGAVRCGVNAIPGLSPGAIGNWARSLHSAGSAGLLQDAITYKGVGAPLIAGSYKGSNWTGVGYGAPQEVGGAKYVPHTAISTVTVLPSSPTIFKCVVGAEPDSSSSDRRVRQPVWFVNLPAPLELSSGDVVEITHTTWAPVPSGYDGTAGTVPPIQPIATGTVDVEYLDINGIPVSTEQRQFTVYSPTVVFQSSNSAAQNMFLSAPWQASTNYGWEGFAPDLDTAFTKLAPNTPRTGTVRGISTENRRSAGDVLPGVEYNFFGRRWYLDVSIPAGGTSDVVVQALRFTRINGQDSTSTRSVSAMLAQTTPRGDDGITWALDAPIVVPPENSITLRVYVQINWDPPQGFKDEFPNWTPSD